MKLAKLLKTAAMLTAVCLTACSSPAEQANVEQEGNLLERIQQKGEMTVGLEGDWAPWSYHDTATNELVGFDTEVAQKIGEKLGVKVNVVEAPWESLFAGLDSERYDMVVNGVDITEERSQKYDFSEPYAYNHTVLIVRNDNEDIKSFDDLKDKNTVNSIGSTYMELAEQFGAKTTGVSTLNDTLQNVIDKRADATLNAEVSYLDYLSEHPDAPVKVAATYDDATKVAIPTRKGNPEFTEAVSNAIKEMKESGELRSLSEKYFKSDITEE